VLRGIMRSYGVRRRSVSAPPMSAKMVNPRITPMSLARPDGSNGALLALGRHRCSIVAVTAAGERRIQAPGDGREGLMGHAGKARRALARDQLRESLF